MGNKVKALLIPALAAVIVAVGGSTAGAIDEPANVIKYRQSVMSAIAGHIGAIAGVVKGEVSFKGHVSAHARAMHAMSNLLYDIFPPGSGEGETRALPKIWEEPEKFRAAIDAFRNESGKLAQVAEGGDLAAIGAQLEAVGKTCGGCHKPYRKEKK